MSTKPGLTLRRLVASYSGAKAVNGRKQLETAVLLALLSCAPLFSPALAQTQQAVPAQQNSAATNATNAPAAVPAQRVQMPGLPHFGKISPQLYRGAQPKDQGFAELKKMGVDIVVNLRDGKDDISRERVKVEAQGMQYVSIPWSGFDSPNNQQIAQFLELLRAHPDKKVFVHCQRGAERTGVMVACYRISAEKWTSQQALDEMEEFRFRGFWFRNLKKYVKEFPSLLSSDPYLRKAAASSP